MTTEAQKRAQARYDAKRGRALMIRVPDAAQWLDPLRLADETREEALLRLAKTAANAPAPVFSEPHDG